jgi:hypothetical protein
MMNPSTVSGVHSVRIGRDGSMTDLIFFERTALLHRDGMRCNSGAENSRSFAASRSS